VNAAIISRYTEGLHPFPCRNAETEQSFSVMIIMVVGSCVIILKMQISILKLQISKLKRQNEMVMFWREKTSLADVKHDPVD
jgi:hypothetical protein